MDSNHGEELSLVQALLGGLLVAGAVSTVRIFWHALPFSLYETYVFLTAMAVASLVFYLAPRAMRKFGIRAARLMAVGVLICIGILALKLPCIIWSHCSAPKATSVQRLLTDKVPFQLNLILDDSELGKHLTRSQFTAGSQVVNKMLTQNKEGNDTALYVVFENPQQFQVSNSSLEPLEGCLLPEINSRWFADEQSGRIVCETITENGHESRVFLVGAQPWDFFDRVVIQQWWAVLLGFVWLAYLVWS